MTKSEFDSMFKEVIIPSIVEQFEQDGIPDGPARREAYNNLTDSYCKDGTITDAQYNNWCIPDSLETFTPSYSQMKEAGY